ncbi:uncharacterized protein LOC107521579 isoform X2 [Rousettus aegyptiacus]|nr:uncharacterized protein LOC107521579 isoform X2 [Rousettus aegyptiacus]
MQGLETRSLKSVLTGQNQVVSGVMLPPEALEGNPSTPCFFRPLVATAIPWFATTSLQSSSVHYLYHLSKWSSRAWAEKRNQEVPEKNGQEFSMIQDAAKANNFKPLFTSNQKTTVNAWGVGEGCPLILFQSGVLTEVDNQNSGLLIIRKR